MPLKITSVVLDYARHHGFCSVLSCMSCLAWLKLNRAYLPKHFKAFCQAKQLASPHMAPASKLAVQSAYLDTPRSPLVS